MDYNKRTKYRFYYTEFKRTADKYCGNCKFWKDTCTKKVAIRECKKKHIKELSSDLYNNG